MTEGSLNILFEDPFWVGVFEFTDESGLHVSKFTFGAEPTTQEVIEFVEKHHKELQYSAPVKVERKPKSTNPKRLLRQARKASADTGIGTKSQQALKAQQEQNKIERKTQSKERKEEMERLQFELRQQKKREKHKGH